jgi:hypothetical protein
MMPSRQQQLFKLPPPPMPSRRRRRPDDVAAAAAPQQAQAPPIPRCPPPPPPSRRSHRSPAAGRPAVVAAAAAANILPMAPDSSGGTPGASCNMQNALPIHHTIHHTPRSFMEFNKFGMCSAAKVLAKFLQSSYKVPAKFWQVPAELQQGSDKFCHSDSLSKNMLEKF